MDFRNEQKYLCTKGDVQILRSRLRGLLSMDSHTPNDAGYRVRSVYFDDCDDRALDQNLDGVDDRVKFRIRMYNTDTSYIRLEVKRKKAGLTSKEDCLLTREQTEAILSGHCTAVTADSPAPLRYLYAEMNTHLLRPRAVIEYSRAAMTGAPGNVRITFDTGLGCTADCTRFLEPVIPLRPILPAGQAVLEVKYDAFLPDWIAQTVELGNLRQMTFSKYAYARLLLRGTPVL